MQKDTCTPMFIASLFIVANIWKQPNWPSTDKWTKKMWYVLATRTKLKPAICSNVDEPREYQA